MTEEQFYDAEITIRFRVPFGSPKENIKGLTSGLGKTMVENILKDVRDEFGYKLGRYYIRDLRAVNERYIPEEE